MADQQNAARKLERELKKATTTSAVRLVDRKASALAKIQGLKK